MPSRTDDSAFLAVAGSQDVRLFDLGSFDRLVRSLPNPTNQRPRVVQFVGGNHKRLALRQVFPHNNFSRHRQNHIANLHTDTSTLHHDEPLLILDSDPNQNVTTRPPDVLVSQSMPLSWYCADATPETISDTIHSRLLFPLADLICVFLDDFKSVRHLNERLTHWIHIGSSSCLDPVVRPRLLIVVSESVKPAAFSQFSDANRDDNPTSCFSSITIFHLGRDHLSPLARYRRLRETVSSLTTEQGELRRVHHVLFSAVHLLALFHGAVRHFAQNIHEPFNFLSVTRPSDTLKYDCSQYLNDFIKMCRAESIEYSQFIDFIGTAFLLDAYPPGMHYFDPSWMFRDRYMSICVLALQEHGDYPMTKSISHDICQSFIKFAKTISNGGRSADVRKEFLRTNPEQWKRLRTNRSCLCCLLRPPEPPTVCGHGLCDNCVLIYGTELPSSEYVFTMKQCLLCEQSLTSQITVKAPTRGISMLSADGGGTRGAITLESLCMLQELLGDLPVQDLFDYAIGTSVGGLIILCLFALRWTPQKCSKVFDALSKEVFEIQQTSPLLSLKRFFRSWVADGIYDPMVYETKLKKIFGPNTRLFGDTANTTSGSRFGVVTTSISDATPFVLCNYNGVVPREEFRGYEMLRPEKIEDEPFTWEAARATSAAPLLYRTAQIREAGDFQDGGLKHNNPSRLACWESRRLWPTIHMPDVFVSLGTGSPPETAKSRPSYFRHFLLDGFIPRLFRSCMTKSDGEIMWGEFVNSLDIKQRRRYHRLNVPLPGAALLVDVDMMARQRESVRLHPTSKATRLEIVKALLVSCLFMEVKTKPLHDSGRYRVEAVIRSKIHANLLISTFKRFQIDTVRYETEYEVLCKEDSFEAGICTSCHRYARAITFEYHLYLAKVRSAPSLNRSIGTLSNRVSTVPSARLIMVYQDVLHAHHV